MYTQNSVENAFDFSLYPVDISSFLMPPHRSHGLADLPSHESSVEYHPTSIAQYALAHWNEYLATNNVSHCNMFLAQAQWLIEHEARIGNDAGGWPISSFRPDVHGEGLCLSALTQGNALSVLVRAYKLTQKDVFLEVAGRVVRTFERDVLDGGVSTPIGKDGIFFEEIAVYPATHALSGFMFALFGLYDYMALTGSVEVKELIQRSLSTMHALLDEFDVGFWTRTDLLHRHLAPSAHLALQTMLLEALATYSGCEHCSMLASEWKRYQRQLGPRLRYLISNCCTSFGSMLLRRMRSMLFPQAKVSPVLRVCVPITAFPVTGGMRTVVAKIAQVTEDIWRLEYLTQQIGPQPRGFIIHQFGTRKMSPWQFPTVWLYVLAGFWKLISLLRHGAGYHVILLQDGVFTASFAALAGKMTGIRSVCIDHGNLNLLNSRIYRAERIRGLAAKRWPHRLLIRLLSMWYWPSLHLLAWFGARLVDHYFIPGVMGDGVEEACKRLGIPSSRISRFANMIDMDRHPEPDAAKRANMRKENGISDDAIVITMICRLTLEKGIDIALEAINRTLSALSPALRMQVRVVIAGDGPLRKQVEENIYKLGLSKTCLLWGEASTEEVISLLGLSDIFLFTSWRAAGYPLAILEAMASGCAVIASTEPLANEYMLAEGRGITVPVGDADQTARALVRLVNDPKLCRQMGDLARNYVARQHSATRLRRALMRVTYWSALDTLLHGEMGSKT